MGRKDIKYNKLNITKHNLLYHIKNLLRKNRSGTILNKQVEEYETK